MSEGAAQRLVSLSRLGSHSSSRSETAEEETAFFNDGD